MRSRHLSALALAAGLLAGCGGGSASTPATAQDAHRPSARDAERLLGSSFRRGLYRLAVMTQPGDDPADLGQSLPTGVVDRTRCDGGGRDDMRCAVTWQSVQGRAERTTYAVEVTDRGCLYATALPSLRQILDVTTEAPTESPLSALVATVSGC